MESFVFLCFIQKHIYRSDSCDAKYELNVESYSSLVIEVLTQ